MTTFFTAAEIAELTEQDESAMQSTCTLRRVTRSDDGAGGWMETETTSTVKCRFEAASGREAVSADQLQAFGRHHVALPKTTNVNGIDRVSVDGRAYKVIYVSPVHTYSTSLTLGVEDA